MTELVILRGQMWRNIDGRYATVRDFSEYTCGWMVAVTPGASHDPDKERSLVPEDEFRKHWNFGGPPHEVTAA